MASQVERIDGEAAGNDALRDVLVAPAVLGVAMDDGDSRLRRAVREPCPLEELKASALEGPFVSLHLRLIASRGA